MLKYIYFLVFINISAFAYYPINIPTRVSNPDKKYLSADLYSNDTTNPKPVILIQTPYNKNFYRIPNNIPGINGSNFNFDTIDYNYIVVDWRGFYGSKSADSALYNRGLDGYDIIEWIANQKWSNGKVGTWGGSALGMIQFQTAAEQPPHLVCAAPYIKDFLTKYEDYYCGGVFRKEHTESLEKLGFVNVNLILSHPDKDIYWNYIENNSDLSSKIKIPMLLVTGWFDHYPSEVIRAFDDLSKKSDISVINTHKLIIGPWLHTSLGIEKQGILNYPNAADIPNNYGKQFLDYYLLNAKNDWILKPKINYYQMGDSNLGGNVWLTADDWKNIKRKYDTLFINDEKKLLSSPPPPKMSPVPYYPDTIIFNPKDPSPTIGGSRFNPFDKTIPLGPQDLSNTVENRNDVLVFSTPVLTQDIKLNGRINLVLYISSDKEDTDFGVRLTDVYPDGESIILTQGIQRARFRTNLNKEILLNPGNIDSINFSLDDIANTFHKGHRLRIDVTSSNYPMFDINLNNGKQLYKAGDTLTATNLIYHSDKYSSRIIVPVLDEQTDIAKINTTINEDDIKFYPNPASDFIHISSSSDFKNVSIFNIIGDIVCSNNISSRECIFNINNLPVGVYFIRIIFCDKISIKIFNVMR